MSGDYRPAARQAIKEMLEGQMDHGADRRLAEMEARDAADRRNGWFERRLTTHGCWLAIPLGTGPQAGIDFDFPCALIYFPIVPRLLCTR